MTDLGPGRILFDFVRHWSRRSASGDAAMAEQGRLVLVCEAVHSLTERGAPATVSAVAHDIGIDQSGASRLIASATEAGHLVLATSTSDRRRREASLTPAGRSMLSQAHGWQENVFDQLTSDWSDARRREFQRAMTDLMDRSHALDA